MRSTCDAVTTEAVDFDERIDILQLLLTQALQPVVCSQAASRLWADEDFPRLGQTGQS